MWSKRDNNAQWRALRAIYMGCQAVLLSAGIFLAISFCCLRVNSNTMLYLYLYLLGFLVWGIAFPSVHLLSARPAWVEPSTARSSVATAKVFWVANLLAMLACFLAFLFRFFSH